MLFYLPDFKNYIVRKKSFSIWLISYVVLTNYLLVRCNAVNFLFFAEILCLVIALEIYPIKVLCNPVFSFLGKQIFGIYIWHILLYFLLRNFIQNVFLIWCLVIGGAVLLAIFSSVFIEKPVVAGLKKLWQGVHHE